MENEHTVTMKPSNQRVSLVALTKEYASNASIHGVGYIFSAATALEKLIW